MLNQAVRGLDSYRARALKSTLKVPGLRGVFFKRPRRLAVFFLLAVFVNLLIALKAPLWALVLGPMVFGVPHLASSLRYVPRLAAREPRSLTPGFYSALGLVFVLMAALRIWALGHPGVLDGEGSSNWSELLAAVLLVAAWTAGWRESLARSAAAGLLLSGVAALTWFWPGETLGGLVLVHGFVGFVYWWRRSREAGDRLCALAALAVFSAVTFLILSGVFDSWTTSRPMAILGGSIDELSLGAMMFPRGSAQLGFRAVSAYAFGQGMHYFVWLKAIPELELAQSHPASLAHSVRLLGRELGRGVWISAALLSLALLGGAVWVALPQARILYLAAASFHGYLELAGLPLARRIAPA